MKAKKKAKKHKPDWPQMFADRIIDLENWKIDCENRVAAIERQLTGTNAVPDQPPPTTG